jgi:hypothetical protein
METKRIARLINAAIDVVALLIENAPVRIDEKRLAEILGPNPVSTQFFAINPTTQPISTPEVKQGASKLSHIATPPGVSEEHYCYDCASKHLGTAKVLLREALQRAVKGEPKEAILEKVRGAYEELMGAEDDTQALSDERTRQINAMIRDVRKWFYDTGVIVDTDQNKIAEALSKVDMLNNEVYTEIERRKARLKEFLTKVEEKVKELKEKVETVGKPGEH